jgi:hypothetical protein
MPQPDSSKTTYYNMTEATKVSNNSTKLADSAPLYPLIEFPEGGDLKDFYFNLRVSMVIAHVVSYFNTF